MQRRYHLFFESLYDLVQQHEVLRLVRDAALCTQAHSHATLLVGTRVCACVRAGSLLRELQKCSGCTPSRLCLVRDANRKLVQQAHAPLR